MAVAYVALGLNGEVGELVEKLIAPGPSGYDAIIGEIGDIAWYVVRCAAEAGVILDLGRVGAETMGISHWADKHAELCKKFVRDGSLVHGMFLEEIWFLLSSLAWTFSASMNDVLDANLAKLVSRRDRGKLGGSGDER